LAAPPFAQKRRWQPPTELGWKGAERCGRRRPPGGETRQPRLCRGCRV